MSRLRPLQQTELSAEQLEVWDAITSSRGPDLVDGRGGLIGPFNAMVHASRIGATQSRLGQQLRFESSIAADLKEVAICTVGAHWKAEFEFWAHSSLAIKAGVDRAIVEAIREGGHPHFPEDDNGSAQAAVYRFTSQLLNTNRVDSDLYTTVEALLGERGLVELTALIGYYCMISLTLNVFEVPLPVGEDRVWAD